MKKHNNLYFLVIAFFMMLSLTSCKKNYTINLDYQTDQGKVTIIEAKEDGKYVKNEKIIIKVEENLGFTLNEFTVNGKKVEKAYTYETNITENLEVKVVFTKNQYNVNVNYNKDLGTVTVVPTANTYGYDDEVTVEVKPNKYVEVKTFTVNGNAATLTDNKYTFKVDQNAEVNVEFEKVAFVVNVEYNEALGNVKLTPEKEVYAKGEEVTVEVTTNQYVTVTGVKVAGDVVTLTDNKYTFAVNDDTVVEVELFEDAPEPLSDARLQSLQNNVKFEGAYLIDATGEDYDSTNSILTIFGTDIIQQIETNLMTGKLSYSVIYVNNNGMLATAEKAMDNTIEIVDTETTFEQGYNQFNQLTVADFLEVEDGIYTIVDPVVAAVVAENITGWKEDIETFLIYFEGDLATKIEIVTKEMVIEEGFNYVATYEFEVSEHGTAEVDKSLIEPFERVAEHEELETALANAQAATNYTINGVDTEEGGEPSEYVNYVTEKAIYGVYTEEASGYVELEGSIYTFVYDTEAKKASVTNVVNGLGTIDSIQAIFEYVTVEFFDYQGEGVFVLKDNDYAGIFAQCFAEGYIEIYQYAYATSLAIIIKDNALYQVKIGYDIDGVIGELILTYSNFDNTTLPINFETYDIENVLEGFIGKYSDFYGNTLSISQEGIFVNDLPFAFVSYEAEYMALIGIVGDEVYYIQLWTTYQLYMFNAYGDVATTLSRNADDFTPDLIPADFIGTWVDETGDFTLEITETSIKFNGETVQPLSYEGIDQNGQNQYIATYNGLTFIIVYIESEDLFGLMIYSSDLNEDPSVIIFTKSA